MNIAVLDTETSGFPSDPKAQVLEVALSIYNIPTKTVLFSISGILPVKADVPEAVIAIHGIDKPVLKAAIELYAESVMFDGFLSVDTWARETLEDFDPECIVAHYAAFDREMLTRSDPWWDDQTWVCSKDHLKFPSAGRSKRMQHLAVDHGIIGIQTHRAAGDVDMLCQLLALVPDLQEQIATRLAGNLVQFKALVSYDNRHLAKEAGFRWFSEQKIWVKELPEDFDVSSLPFRVVRTGG